MINTIEKKKNGIGSIFAKTKNAWMESKLYLIDNNNIPIKKLEKNTKKYISSLLINFLFSIWFTSLLTLLYKHCIGYKIIKIELKKYRYYGII